MLDRKEDDNNILVYGHNRVTQYLCITSMGKIRNGTISLKMSGL